MHLDHTYLPDLPRCECGSYAINDHPERTLCDRCWRDAEIERLREEVKRLTAAEAAQTDDSDLLKYHQPTNAVQDAINRTPEHL